MVFLQPLTAALSAVRAGLADIWRDLFSAAACNLIWLVCQVLVLPGPPATLALFYFANRTARGEVTDVGDFWDGLRRHWRPAWRWGIANLAVVGLLLGDYWLTARLFEGSLAQWLQGLYLAVLAGWAGLQFFALAFYFEMEEPGLRLAWRNAAALVGRHPLYSVTWLGGVLAVLALGVLAFMLSGAFGAVFAALAANHAVRERLALFRTTRQGSDAFRTSPSESDLAA